MYVTSSSTIVISYTILAPAVSKRESDPKKSAQGILETIQLETELYRIGNTKACLYPYSLSSFLRDKKKECSVSLSSLSSSHSSSLIYLLLLSLAWFELLCVGSFWDKKRWPPFKVSKLSVCPLLYPQTRLLLDIHPLYHKNKVTLLTC